MDRPAQQSILVVDDNDTFRDRLARALRRRGFEVHTARDYEEAVNEAREESPELAVVDLRMPGRGGLDLLKALKKIDATTRVVVLTGYGSIATAVEAIHLGAINYLSKPADADEILAAFSPDALDETPSPQREEYVPPSLARAEWEHINRVLKDCGGNISKAARLLGIHRRSLQRKLQKYPPEH